MIEGIPTFVRDLAAILAIDMTPSTHLAAGFMSFGFGSYTIAGDRALTILWRRGFVHTIEDPFGDLRDRLPAVVARHPVERAVARDKEPQLAAYEYAWLLRDDPRRLAPAELPRGLFDRLTASPRTESDLDRPHRGYEGADDAAADLSAALLAEARDQPQGRI